MIPIPQGTRDFSPSQMLKRNHIFDTIKKVFQKFGFLPLETPTMENLSVLMGKYGEEGDKLLYRILNSGDFLKDAKVSDFENGYKTLAPKIAEKGLRYDLTVPFARYVVMNQHQIVFPFKRYQIQPVWRADRPQKGRYREFYQCDADVVGTDSLICEAEIVLMINEALQNLGIQDFTIKINNRKILAGIAQAVEADGKESDLCVAIDKLDKIGLEKVNEELKERGFSETSVQKLQPILHINGNANEKIQALKQILAQSEQGTKGLNELEEVLNLVESFGLSNPHLEFDITLARGLSYYTGAIFEVKVNNVQIGSISGGGRYDNLTGVFGLPNVSGVGFSFGVDRVYDVMEELQLFPQHAANSTQILLACFDEEAQKYALPLLKKVRDANIKAEIYPNVKKMKNQLSYANDKNIPFVIVIGSDEMQSGKLAFKNMQTGVQVSLTIDEIVANIK